MTRDEIIACLTGFPQRLTEAIHGLDAGSARKRPPSGDWSVIEVVCHLRDYAEIFNSRLQRALTEDNPAVLSYDNEDLASSREYASQDLSRVLEAHRLIRERMMATISGLTEEQWSRTVRHPEWGQPSVEWLMNRCAEHEIEHLRDIEKVRRESEVSC
jgi:hypothetical protein